MLCVCECFLIFNRSGGFDVKKQLFFDDSLLYGRDHVKRGYGKLERIAEYNDGVCSTDFCTGSVFRLENGAYRMLYFGQSAEFEDKKLFSAISEDGVNFSPEAVELVGEHAYAHEIMHLSKGGEVAFIYEDEGSADRYKMLMSEFQPDTFTVKDVLYTSKDLLHWELAEHVSWGDGTEPLVSVYYNRHKANHTVIQRPFWGCRTVGCKTTSDWKSFTEYRHVLGVDSCDEALAELYGMYAFEYDGMYIGAAHIYNGLHSEYNAKYLNGNIECELAYSYDGEYWRRSLREPFLSGGEECPLVWLSAMVRRENDLLFYGSASERIHGPAFSEPGRGRLFVYRLRQDGFIALESEDAVTPSRVITREKLWKGGELHLNVCAANVTVGVYETFEAPGAPTNSLGSAEPIDGYRAEDCIPFSGDCIDFIPQYKNGRTLSQLAGKTLVFEINYTNGALYSLSGDYIDLYNTEGVRYRKLGVLPARA